MHCPDYLIVSCATTQVSCKRIANFLLGRVGFAVEQRLGCYQKARSTDPALQCRVVDEFLLQDMQFATLSQSFYGTDFAPVGLGAEHQARTDQPSIEGDAAGTTVAGATAFLDPG